MFSKVFQLSGLTCPSCQKICEMVIGDIAGVTKITVDLKSQTARIDSETEIDSDAIREALKQTHYQLVE